MNDLNTFYHGVLNELEFSISGYPNLEQNKDEDHRIKEKIRELFDRICESPVFVGKNHLGFVSYAYSILDKIDPFKIRSIVNASFYFNSFKELSFERFIVNDYELFKQSIQGYEHSEIKITNGSNLRTSEITSMLFVNPVNYRIKTTERKNTVVKFDKHIDTLVFEVPFSSIFECAEDENPSSIKERLFKLYETYLINNKELKNTLIKKTNEYVGSGQESSDFIVESLINKKGVNTVIETLYRKILLLDETNGCVFFGKNPEKNTIDAFVKLILSHAFLSAMFDCWVENIPSVVKVDEKKNEKKCLGTIVIGYSIDKEISAAERIYFKLLSERISYNLAAQCVIDINHEIEKQATRAAISQVMARNTSHNIGAHVMNKLIGDLNQLNFKKFKNYFSEIELYGDESDNSKILLNQISHFNNYVKCRMDYLADISFGTQMMQTNKYAYEDLFISLDKVRLLLEHISGLDNFGYEIKFKRNGKDFKNDNNSMGEDDLLVAIPNDILGTQAFYNILENIIRNTAKHSDKSIVKYRKVVFIVNFIDDIQKSEEYINADNKIEIENILNEFVAVEIYDNIPVEDEKKDLADSEKKAYLAPTYKELDKFDSKIDSIVFCQNEKLNEDILRENKLRSYSLGLVEMDASAAYLRKRPVEYINHKSYDIQYDASWSRDTELNGGNQDIRGINCRHFLKAIKKSVEIEEEKNRKTEYYLGYRFFLHRPAVVLVVTELYKENEESNNKKKDELKKQGVWLVPPTEFKNDLEKGKVYPHEFVVIDSNIELNKTGETDFLEYYKTSLPVRVLNSSNNISDLLSKSADEIEKYCWEKLEKDKYNLTIVINNGIDKYCPEFQAIFLDHLYSTDGTKKESKEVVGTWDKNKNANYVEALSSLAQSKMPDFYKITHVHCKHKNTSVENFKCYIRKLKNDDLAKRKIKEAILNKVIVIDERIQEAAENRSFMEIPFKCLYAKTNVRVPDKSINLSANSYTDDIKGNIERYIVSQTANTLPTDFILIHYSILERMYQKKEINKKLDELIGKSKINVVFTSGRGTPDSLTEKVRFVNLSSVITAFVDVRCKYAINYLLNSSRKSNNI